MPQHCSTALFCLQGMVDLGNGRGAGALPLWFRYDLAASLVWKRGNVCCSRFTMKGPSIFDSILSKPGNCLTSKACPCQACTIGASVPLERFLHFKPSKGQNKYCAWIATIPEKVEQPKHKCVYFLDTKQSTLLTDKQPESVFDTLGSKSAEFTQAVRKCLFTLPKN